jgi:hypothetical protein
MPDMLIRDVPDDPDVMSGASALVRLAASPSSG